MNKMSKNMWLLLKIYYNQSDGILKINGIILDDKIIRITRGVKQGGVMSPMLFNVYK